MKKLYLFCSAGMSSSIIAKKMQEVANQKNLDVEVNYFPESKMNEKGSEADVILLSPQVKYLEKDVRAKYSNKPVYLIEMLDYGMLNGEAILTKSLSV
ncbi:MAG: PTS sugar transporter subunit IIB [Alphaproteobacteria bacterium]|jgi:PTS system cellobiose-specific IIB component|nr:PTS sugar transporter subunit IIB [Alphaproteobacteria bacterium]